MSYFLLLQASLAAAFNADWIPPRRHAGAVEQAIAAVHPRSDHPSIHPSIHTSIHPFIHPSSIRLKVLRLLSSSFPVIK